jgi:hypothetical protein
MYADAGDKFQTKLERSPFRQRNGLALDGGTTRERVGNRCPASCRLLRGSQGPSLKVVDQDVHTNQEYP